MEKKNKHYERKRGFTEYHSHLEPLGYCSVTATSCVQTVLSHFSRAQLFVSPWTLARQAPLSMGFSMQVYWSGLPCPPPGDLPNPGTEPRSPASQADSLPSESPGKPHMVRSAIQMGLSPLDTPSTCGINHSPRPQLAPRPALLLHPWLPLPLPKSLHGGSEEVQKSRHSHSHIFSFPPLTLHAV